MRNVDKEKLVLVHDKGDLIVDQPLESKEIGYYQDSWNRFKKNRGALIAFTIICIIMVFVVVGPYIKNYDLFEKDSTAAARLDRLVPKIPFLEDFGIADGTQWVTRGRRYLTHMYHSEFGEGIILEGFPEELKEDPNHPDYANQSNLTVKVDYYKYMNYKISYMPEDYFRILDDNAVDPSTSDDKDPLASVRQIITKDQFEDLMAKNYIIDILAIRVSGASVNYEVRVNQFLYSLDQLPEDTYFWFGTNYQGKDLFTIIWQGAQVSLIMALSVTIINSVIGLLIGSVVGYYGGVLDLLFDRFVEILASLPLLSILMLLILRFGPAEWVVVLAFTVTGWIGSYGTGRMQFYRFKNREYVLAARTLGASDARIMFKHIFPNTLGLIVTNYVLAIPSFVFLEASYSFLGIINYQNQTSIGMLIDQGQDYMQEFPHLLLFPSVYIAVLMIAFNLFGNGLRDAFNPSLRGVE